MARSKQTKAERLRLPEEPIHVIIEPLTRFLHVEAASGVVLLFATAAALILANSGMSYQFLAFWKTEVGFRVGSFEFQHSLKHLINDGFMAIFFFVIGLEVKRELVIGELRDMRRAAFPIAAALGGMVVPAGIYLVFEMGQSGQDGWGIPMATDIAFVVGCMALLGPRIPHSLRITLLSLAIADDIGAILVIAIGYTEHLSLKWLAAGFLGIGVVFGLCRLGVRSFMVYTAIGAFVWFAFHESGVHATIAGVILGLMTPAHSYVSTELFERFLHRAQHTLQGDWEAVPHRAARVRTFREAARETIPPLEYLENVLHPWVAFIIMPIFALVNAGVPIVMSDIRSQLAMAVIVGLVLGKPLGITLVSWIAVKMGLARLPEELSWKVIIAGGCLCGIGFTMALFIAGLAMSADLLNRAKIGVLGGSALSAVIGMVLLATFLPKNTVKNE